MKKLMGLSSMWLASVFFLAVTAHGAEHCVTSVAELTTALSGSQNNGQDDLIKVVQGTYTVNGNYSSSQGYSITLEGGYTAGCATRTVNPANTVLDGNNTGGVLCLANSSGGNIQVDGFTIQNGNAEGISGGGVYADSNTNSTNAGSITITNNIIIDNETDYNGGGVFAYSYSKTGQANAVTLINNIIAGNSAPTGYSGGVYAYSESTSLSGETITLINNTIIENSASDTGGAYILTDGPAIQCYNNIIWGNTSATTDDINLVTPSGGKAYGYNNDYHEISGIWNGGSGGYIDTDPLLSDTYHLIKGSPCIDTGTNSAPYLPATDIDGDDRMIDGNRDGTATADMGADEFISRGIIAHLLLLIN